jgi:hypothetical protein
MNHDVFISYAHEDKDIAFAACSALESQGMTCWIAPRNILPSMDWGAAIIEAIESAKVMVLIFSSHANDSPQIKREVERAVNKGVGLLPFRIENVEPSKTLEYFISTQHWMEALTPALDKHLAELTDAVKLVIGANTPGKAVPEPAASPSVTQQALQADQAPATTPANASATRKNAPPAADTAGPAASPLQRFLPGIAIGIAIALVAGGVTWGILSSKDNQADKTDQASGAAPVTTVPVAGDNRTQDENNALKLEKLKKGVATATDKLKQFFDKPPGDVFKNTQGTTATETEEP